MSHSSLTTPNGPVYRVDKFTVPAQSVPAFMARVQLIKGMLDTMAGCRQNLVLQQAGESGEVKVVTIAEWESRQAITAAMVQVQVRYAAQGFDPAAFMQALDVKADMGVYSPA